MQHRKRTNLAFTGGSLLVLLFIAMFPILWIVNAVKFAKCDFQAPYKGEVLHGIGLVTPFFVVTSFLSYK